MDKMNRRQFVGTSAAVLGAAGLRLPVWSQAASTTATPGLPLLLGVDYYPDQTPESLWEEDARRISDAIRRDAHLLPRFDGDRREGDVRGPAAAAAAVGAAVGMDSVWTAGEGVGASSCDHGRSKAGGDTGVMARGGAAGSCGSEGAADWGWGAATAAVMPRRCSTRPRRRDNSSTWRWSRVSGSSAVVGSGF